MSRAPRALALLLAAAALAPRAQAAGYAINDQGARAMAGGLATAATLAGPESLFYNPAGLAELDGWSLGAGGTLLLADFSSRPEETGELWWQSRRDHFEVPHLYVGRRLRGRFSVGLSVNAPYGLATEWDADFPGRFISRLADLKTVQVAPLAAVRLPRGWSVGFGPTWTHGEVHLVRDVDLSVFRNGHQAEADLSGDGAAWGWRAGARWRGASGWAFGLAATGDVDVRYDGEVDYTVPLLGAFSLDQAIANLFQDGPAGTTLTLPATVSAGVGRAHAKWSWAADVTWTHWSVLQSVVVDLEPIEVGGQSLVVEEFTVNDWNDVLALRGGVRRKVGERWTWSAGAYFDQSPVPVETADPLLPDSDRVSLTGGATYARGGFTVDVAAQAVIFDDLDTRGTTNEFPSKYDSAVQALGFTLGWRWGARHEK